MSLSVRKRYRSFSFSPEEGREKLGFSAGKWKVMLMPLFPSALVNAECRGLSTGKHHQTEKLSASLNAQRQPAPI